MPGWQTAQLSCTERPVLGDGELHIWSADLQGNPPTAVLSGEELERARRVIRPQARQRWLAARVFLRTLLGSYLGVDPGSLLFAIEGRGKPVLAERRSCWLHFNLSHSGPLALCAVSRMCAVGVDIQLLARDMDVRAWTGLEAECKRTGLGLGGGGERSSGPRPWLAQLELEGAGAGAVALALPPSAIFVGSWSYFRISDRF